MHSFYLDAIRNFEGFTPQAAWDYAQFSNGFGTRARFAGEVIDRTEAERRFRAEVSNARSIVEKAAPDVDEGTKAALTSLTYNAGTSWIESGLGDAVRRGDIETAREIFQKYNKAGGEVLPGLVSRRSQEALWIGNPDAVASSMVAQASNAIAGDSARLPPVVVESADGSSSLAEALNARAHSRADFGSSGASANPFARGPRTERPQLPVTLAAAASEALNAMIEGERLGPSGVAELARLAALGRGSDLAQASGDRRDDDKQTRRV